MAVATEKFVTGYSDFELWFESLAHAYHVHFNDGVVESVPSVSDITDYLPKWLSAWAQRIGVEGSQELVRRAIRNGPGGPGGEVVPLDLSRFSLDDSDFNIGLIQDLGMDFKAVKGRAADRGSAVHAAFRNWVENGILPNPTFYSGETAGYIASLRMLCETLEGYCESLLCERPIASVQYGYAGTPDWLMRVTERVQVCKGGEVRRSYINLEEGEMWLLDLKTSSQVYMSHKYQLSAYELALRELMIVRPASPLKRAIVLIKPDGKGYNIKEQPECVSGFLGALHIYNSEKRPEGFCGRTTFVGLGGV